MSWELQTVPRNGPSGRQVFAARICNNQLHNRGISGDVAGFARNMACFEASVEAPHLCLSLAIDSEKLVNLLGQMDIRRNSISTEAKRGIAVNAAPTELLDAMVRLLRLLETPSEIPIMAPLLEQEILYRLLTGTDGERLVNIATIDSQANRIARAISWLRQNFALPSRSNNSLNT